MEYAESIIDLIGNTPLVRLTRVTRELGPADRQPLILAKLEMLNPGGSVKDRIGLPMIEAAERDGLLKRGGTIIEPTSGNTGHGLAIAAALKGYRCIFVMADKQSTEKQALLRAYGAEVVLCPTNVEPESPESYYSVARATRPRYPGRLPARPVLEQEQPGGALPNDRTGDLAPDGGQDHAPGGRRPGRAARSAGRPLPEGAEAGRRHGRSGPGGLRPERRHRAAVPDRRNRRGLLPGTYDASVVDRWVRVSDRDAFAMARRITREEGILAGESCGTALVATLTIARELVAAGEGQRQGDRGDIPRRRPQLSVEAVQRRVDAGQRPARIGHLRESCR